MGEKYKRILLFVVLFVFLIGSNNLGHHQITYNGLSQHTTCTQSEEAINRLKNIMYGFSLTTIEAQRHLEKISEKSEQHRFGGNLNKRMLLFYSLLKGLELLGLVGVIYILNMRDKVINYLLAIIYIHKSDGQKEGKHILLHS